MVFNARLKNMFMRYLLFVLVLSLATMTQAHSFDCEKASSLVEKLICQNDTLMELDTKMNTLYRQLIGHPEDQSLVSDQRKWLKERNLLKSEKELIYFYASRVDELEELLLENEKDLYTFGKKFFETGKAEGAISTNGRIVSVDLNNDGVEENVYSDEPLAMGFFYILTPDGKECLELNKNEDIDYNCEKHMIRSFGYRWDFGNYTILKHKGKNYLAYNGSLGYNAKPAFQIIEFNKDWNYRVVCNFKREKQVSSLKFSQNNELCKDVQGGKISVLEAEETLILSWKREEQEDSGIFNKEQLASILDYASNPPNGVKWLSIFSKIDINNDGDLDQLLMIEHQPYLYGKAQFMFLTIMKNDTVFEDVPGFGIHENFFNGFAIFKYNDGFTYISMHYNTDDKPSSYGAIVSKVVGMEKLDICKFEPAFVYSIEDTDTISWRLDRTGSDDDGPES